MISLILYLRARKNPRNVFERYLAESGDRGAWRGIVAGECELPWWLRPAEGALSKNDVRILYGPPLQSLVLLDTIEAESGEPLRAVWPHLRGYIHSGGVEFGPYRDTFRRRFGGGVTFVAAEEPTTGFASDAFGERLTQDDLDFAVHAAQEACGGEAKEYRVDAEYPTVTRSRGRHTWRIEFSALPADLAAFARALDDALGKRPHYRAVRPFLREPMVRLARLVER